MIGLDTNVLARCIVQDDPEQARAAAGLTEGRRTAKSPGYIGVPALVELVWVLTAAYRHEKPVVASVIRRILRTTEFPVEDGETAWAALREFEKGGADFAGPPDRPPQPCAREYADLHVRPWSGR